VSADHTEVANHRQVSSCDAEGVLLLLWVLGARWRTQWGSEKVNECSNQTLVSCGGDPSVHQNTVVATLPHFLVCNCQCTR
jgi:hypothetical protein